jgi:hypothetical protein
LAIPGFPGELGLAVELVEFRPDGEEKGVFDTEFVNSAREAAMAEDGLVQHAGFKGG